MTTKNRLVTSQMPPTHFVQEWTGIHNANIWLEAEEQDDKTWTIYALGQHDTGQLQKWPMHGYLPKNYQIRPQPNLPSFAANANEIRSAQCVILAEKQSFPETLAHLVFFEGLRQEGKMKNADIGNFDSLSRYISHRHDPNHIYRQWAGAKSEEKPDSKTLDQLNTKFQDYAQRLYERIKNTLEP